MAIRHIWALEGEICGPDSREGRSRAQPADHDPRPARVTVRRRATPQARWQTSPRVASNDHAVGAAAPLHRRGGWRRGRDGSCSDAARHDSEAARDLPGASIQFEMGCINTFEMAKYDAQVWHNFAAISQVQVWHCGTPCPT